MFKDSLLETGGKILNKFLVNTGFSRSIYTAAVLNPRNKT
jgi:hypothetical protein